MPGAGSPGTCWSAGTGGGGPLPAPPPPPTASVAGNDLRALAVLQAAGELGVRVPEDVAVAGLDNIPMAAHHRIQLTTVDNHAAEQARIAPGWMLEIISDPDRYAPEPSQPVGRPTLIV